MPTTDKKEFIRTVAVGFLHFIFSLAVLLSSLWLCMALWFQAPVSPLFSKLLMGLWILFALSILGIYFTGHIFSRTKDILLYLIIFILSLCWYFSIEPRQDRQWNPEVARMLSYEKQGNLVTLHNVRNFNWHADGSYDERWETRQYDLNSITGINIITSYWMGPQIAHTLVSFDFANAAPLTFSIEIRKEQNEEFSALGGFFRKYELSLIASDEKDIVYTRSNIRKEQVYFFPVQMPRPEMKALFEEYLQKADQLADTPRWYNTLTSNCTTLIFDMVQAVTWQPLPIDYRLLASGYLPNYMYDLKALDQQLTLQQWYQTAHINPRVQDHDTLSSARFSALARQGLPVSDAY